MADAKLDTLVRREQIAEAALSLVAAEGVKRLSIAAVARRVGLVPSGIYRHFKSKDAMLAAVLELLESKLRANVEAARQGSTDPLERLHGLLVRHIQFIREGRAFPRIIFSDDAMSAPPQRKELVSRIITMYLGEIERFVRDGQQQGCIRKELVPNSVAVMFLGMVVPAAILWHVTDGGFNVTQHAGRAWEMFRTAVVTDPSPRCPKNPGRSKNRCD
jgi:AcrR family transcriptional regulator